MKSFEDYYWSQFDVLNKDTQLARQFGQDVWDYKQKEIDDLQKRIDKLIPLLERYNYAGWTKILKGNQDEN